MKCAMLVLCAAILPLGILLAGCGGSNSSNKNNTGPGSLTAINISYMQTPKLGYSPMPQFPAQTNQFTAGGVYSSYEGTPDVTSSCTWTSSNPAAGSFSSGIPGLFALTNGSNTSGSTQITATYSNGISNTMSVYTSSITYTNASATNYTFYWYGTAPLQAYIIKDANGNFLATNAVYNSQKKH